MTTTRSSFSRSALDVLAIVAIGMGGFIVLYGLTISPASLLGGVHIAAIGLSLSLSGLFATEWAGNRWNLSPTTRNRLSLAFAVFAAVLLLTFVVINFVSFAGPFVDGGSETGI